MVELQNSGFVLTVDPIVLWLLPPVPTTSCRTPSAIGYPAKLDPEALVVVGVTIRNKLYIVVNSVANRPLSSHTVGAKGIGLAPVSESAQVVARLQILSEVVLLRSHRRSHCR